MLLPLPGRYMTLPDLDRELAISLAASIRLSSIKPGPATLVASEMSRADSLSPSARMTAAFLSCAQHHRHELSLQIRVYMRAASRERGAATHKEHLSSESTADHEPGMGPLR